LKKLNKYLEDLATLLTKKEIEFSRKNIYASKCLGCSVSNYCSHKTGRLNELSLPYIKPNLELRPPNLIDKKQK